MSTTTHEHDSHDHKDDHAHGKEEWHVHAHISSVPFMVGIFAALIVLTFITVAVSRVDLGSANSFVAILVATIKAGLVSAFFMHLRYDKPFYAVIFASSFVFLGIMLFFTLDDIGTRSLVDPVNNARIHPRTGEVAPGGYVPLAPLAGGHGEHGGHAEGGEHSAAPAGEHGAAPAAAHH
jgi:cytochrome c oxidase subunit IV